MSTGTSSLRRATRKINYNIYAVNFYDNSIKAVRNEFIRRVQDGLRRWVFVIDLDADLQEAKAYNELHMHSLKQKKADMRTEDPIQIVQNRISELLRQFELINKRIQDELKFDIYQYWLARLNTTVFKEPNQSKNKNDTKRTSKLKGKKTSDTKSMDIKCRTLVAKEHHKVGKGKPLYKRLYIQDQPMNAKLFFIIIGTLDNNFYSALLNLGMPLHGIIHFLPQPCAYDQLVPRPKREKYLKDTNENIRESIYRLRKRANSKTTGIFQQQLPVMSICLAKKYSDDIFNQLSWFFYDIETIFEWYDEFYVKQFNLTDVEMSSNIDLRTSFNIIESLSREGHYLTNAPPSAANDMATIYLYLEGLLNTFAKPRELLTETEVLQLANPTANLNIKVLDKIKVYAHAFHSTLKLKKTERLFVEQTNALLHNIISYMQQIPLANIYHACLEYNILRRYITTGYLVDEVPIQNCNGMPEPLQLNKYARVYFSNDCVVQRLLELIEEHNDYTCIEVYPNLRLYTFKCVLNEVFETEKETILPTCLCFRDFTLYQMEDFLNELITPAMFKEAYEKRDKLLLLQQLSTGTKSIHDEPEDLTVHLSDGQQIKLNMNIFVRQNSLKANKMLSNVKSTISLINEQRKKTLQSEGLGQSTDIRLKKNQNVSIYSQQQELINNDDLPHMGLPIGHAMLNGYNLNDTRQSIKTKTSKYHFDEGKLQLYEERWNFAHINKTLQLLIDNLKLYLHCPLHNVNRTAQNCRLETKNKISLRAFVDTNECAKIVINYPNSLSIYCYDQHAEQIWDKMHAAYNDEKRRLYTPYGCVIVFFNNIDMVLIMRNNGEIYKLYNYIDEDEEEASLSEFTTFRSSISTGSTIATSVENATKKTKKKTARARGGGVTGISIAGTTNMPPTEQSSKTSGEQLPKKKLNKNQKATINSAIKMALLASIENEMHFLDSIMLLYNLNYLHLKLTTTMGYQINVIKNGRVYAGPNTSNEEWLDYYANEAYCMRSDNVKIIWTKDDMRCYHADGTCIITKTLDNVVTSAVDEMETEITQSSSHDNISKYSFSSVKPSIHIDDIYNMQDTNLKHNSTASVNESKSSNKRTLQSLKLKKDTTKYLIAEEAEELSIFDTTYITYESNSFQYHHHNYASVYFSIDLYHSDLRIATDIYAADGLHVQFYQEPLHSDYINTQTVLNTAEQVANEDTTTDEKTATSSVADSINTHVDPSAFNRTNISFTNQQEAIEQTVIEISYGNTKLKLTKAEFQFEMLVRRFGCSQNVYVNREKINLELCYDQSLSSVFRAWVKDLVKFINCNCSKVKTCYFVEKITYDCKKKGFELLPKLPNLRQYSFTTSNVVLDIDKLVPITERLINNFPWYEADMEKFPRFRSSLQSRRSVHDDFPMVLSVNTYIEIPSQMATTERLHQFVEPLDNINFKKLRARLNEVTKFNMYPHLRLVLTKAISERSWRKHQAQHKRHLFLEQQRLGLYMAMLKHKVYPNYDQFMDQCYGHVRNIDFFEFMIQKCNEKADPAFYNPDSEAAGPTDKNKSLEAKEQRSTRRHRKKCLCPKFPL